MTLKGKTMMGIVALTGAAVAFGSAPVVAQGNMAHDKLVAAAKSEGAVVKMRETVWSNPRMRRATESAISKKYGLKFKMDWQAGSLNQVASRLVQESKAGRQASVDVAVGEVNAIAQMIGPEGAGILQEVNWRQYDSGIPESAVVRNGQTVRFTSRISTFAYNTDQIKKPPKTIADLFNPAWKGRMAATPYAAVWDNATIFTDPKIVTDAVMKLVDEGYVTGLVRCGPDLARVASGEFWALAMACSGGPVETLAAKGAPISNEYIKGLSYLAYEYLAIPKRAVHPNSAKLFIVFALSPEGQKILRDFRYQDLGSIPGNLHHGIITKLKNEGRELPEITLDRQLKNKKTVARYKKMYVRAFRRSK